MLEIFLSLNMLSSKLIPFFPFSLPFHLGSSHLHVDRLISANHLGLVKHLVLRF